MPQQRENLFAAWEAKLLAELVALVHSSECSALKRRDKIFVLHLQAQAAGGSVDTRWQRAATLDAEPGAKPGEFSGAQRYYLWRIGYNCREYLQFRLLQTFVVVAWPLPVAGRAAGIAKGHRDSRSRAPPKPVGSRE